MSRRRRIAVVSIGVVLACAIAWRSHRHASPPAGERVATGATMRPPRAAVAAPRVGGRRIAGTVLLDGVPAPGATVRLASRVSQRSVVADASGRFDFGQQLAIEYAVVAEAPHVLGAAIRVDLRDSTARPSPDQLQLLMHPCSASIHGVVRDASGGVIAKARVTHVEDGLIAGAGTDSDDDGSYELCVLTGGNEIVVKANGYAQIYEPLWVYGQLRHDFALVAEAIVVGRVVTTRDRSPVTGATLELSPTQTSWEDGAAPLYASSDSDGRFHFSGVLPGLYRLTGSAEGLVTAHAITLVAEIGSSQDEVLCTLEAARTISGMVVEKETNAPLSGIQVQLAPRSRKPLDALWATTRANGSFVFEHVLPGDFDAVAVDGREYSPGLRVTVADNDVTGVVVELEHGATISGRVTRDGQPVDDAFVETQDTGNPGVRTTTDHDGRYTLRRVPPGNHEIYAESQRIGAFTHGPTLTVAKGDVKTGVDLQLDLAASITGFVVDQNDKPVAGASVRASLLHGRDWGTATTAEDGSFEVRGLSGGGDYIYDVRASEMSGEPFRLAGGKRHPAIAVRDGKTHVSGLRIKIDRDLLAISGRVIDDAGKPIVDAHVSAVATLDGYDWRSPDHTAITDLDGAFAIRNLPANAYGVAARTTWGNASVARIAAGRSDVVLRIPQPGNLDGTLAGFSDAPEVTVRGASGEYIAAVTDRSFVMRTLPAGEYSVRAISSGGQAAASVTIEAGKMAHVALQCSGFGAIEASVVDDVTRRAVPGLRCMVTSDNPAAEFREGTTDNVGIARIDHVPVGNVEVFCRSSNASAMTHVTLEENLIARISLAAHAFEPQRRSHVGMTLDNELADVVVHAIEPGGAADRAGLAVGDVLLRLNDQPLSGMTSDLVLEEIEDTKTGTAIQLAIERGDQQLGVTLTIPSPGP